MMSLNCDKICSKSVKRPFSIKASKKLRVMLSLPPFPPPCVVESKASRPFCLSEVERVGLLTNSRSSGDCLRASLMLRRSDSKVWRLLSPFRHAAW